MKLELKQTLLPFQRLCCFFGLHFLLFTAVRSLFFYWNRVVFLPISANETLNTLLAAAIQDVATVLVVQLPFVVLFLLAQTQNRPWILRLSQVLYMLIIAISLFIPAAAAVYYPFCSRQINYTDMQEAANLIGSEQVWNWQNLPFILGILLVILRVARYTATWFSGAEKQPKTAWIFGLTALASFYFVGIGGFAPRMVRPSSTLYYTSGKYATLATNSVLNVIYTAYLQQNYGELPAYHFLPKATVDSTFSITRNYNKNEGLQKNEGFQKNEDFHKNEGFHKNKGFHKKNVVIFILETFPRAVLHGNDSIKISSSAKAFTPFLDSLRRESLVFDNAFSAGLQSNEGFQGIMGSMPVFEGLIYFKSQYLDHKIRGIGTLLHEEGYDTNFFLGFHPNSFSFGEFTTALGIQHYYSELNYPNYQQNYQAWGIPDYPYFQYVANELNTKKTPFFATIFTTSTHHPYVVPPPYTHRFSLKNQTPHQNAVSYTDFALQQFFAKAQATTWFQNTLFLFISDHSKDLDQQSQYERYRICAWLYDPANPTLRGTNHTVFQQIDVVPTVLDYLHYPHAFAAFGTSVWDSFRPHYAYMQSQEPPYLHQIINQKYLLTYCAATDSIMGLYSIATDKNLKNNLLLHKSPENKTNFGQIAQTLKQALQAFIQTYHTKMRDNAFY
jgi:phosphoglycerol transferase MdoB-like AlkP superfamily enzyme